MKIVFVAEYILWFNNVRELVFFASQFINKDMFGNFETLFSLSIILILGYYLQSGPKIGSFLSTDQVHKFKEDGIVVVDNIFSPEELEQVSEELMKRVENREEGVRAEDLLNLHHNDSYILGNL